MEPTGSRFNGWRGWVVGCLTAAIAWGSFHPALGWAASEVPPSKGILKAPLELDLLAPGAATADGGVVTADTISQDGLTIPSLWFVRDQIADSSNRFSDRLVENWLAYPGSETRPRRIDLVVNQQIWSLLNYLDRYTLINRFGSTARDYQYSLRVFNRQERLLGAYLCSYDSVPNLTATHEVYGQNSTEQASSKSVDQPSLPNCSVILDSSGTGSLRGRSSLLDGF